MTDQRKIYINNILELIKQTPDLFFESKAKDIILKNYGSFLAHTVPYPLQQPQFNYPFSVIMDDFFREYELIEFICTKENLENLSYVMVENLYRALSNLNAMYKEQSPQNNPNLVIQRCGQLLDFVLSFKNIPQNILVSYALDKLDYNNKGIANLQKISREAESSLGHIQDIEQQSKTKLTTITQSMLGDAFSQQQAQLRESMISWLFATYLMGGAIFIIYLILFGNLFGKQIIDFPSVIAKALITFPLIYLFVFTSKAYTVSKRLHEEYAFKVTIAFSLEKYLAIVDKVEKGEVDSKYRDFLIDSIDKIFTSPNKLAFNNKSNKDDGEMTMSELQSLINLIKDVDKK